MKNKMLNEVERYLKRILKNKVKISQSLIITFLMTGMMSSVGYGANLWIDTNWVDGNNNNVNNNLLNRKSKVWFNEGKRHEEYGTVQDEATILTSKLNKTGNKTKFRNKDFDRIVVIGSRAVAGGHGATVMGFQAVAGENSETSETKIVISRDKAKYLMLTEDKYKDELNKYYEIEASSKYILKKQRQNKILDDIIKKEENSRKIDPKSTLNKEGTAIGYKSFARGNEATAMGNDVVAWGDSSIAIGTDNAAGDESVLSRDIFRLYYNARADFNDTSSYAATDFKKHREAPTDVPMYANADSILLGEDRQPISSSDGKIYIRKETLVGNKKTPNYDNGYYVYDPSFDKNFHEFDGKGEYKKLIKHNSEEAKIIKKMSDWNQYELHKKEIDNKYKEYLAKPESKKFKSNTWARGANSIVIGARSIGFGKNSTALGTFALAARDYSTAIGSNTLAFGEKSLAVGNQSYVYSNNSIGIGNTVQAINTGSMVFGANSFAGGRGSLALGDHTFANIKMDDKFNNKKIEKSTFNLSVSEKEKQDYEDKFDIEKLYEKGNTNDIQQIGKQYFLAATTKQAGTGEDKAQQSEDLNGDANQGAIAIGSYSVALGDNAISLGRFAYAKEDSSVAFGRFAFARNKDSVALAPFSRAMGDRALALGHQSLVDADDSMAIGIGSKVLRDIPDTLLSEENKRNKKDPVKNAMAIGNNAEAYFPDSIALGVKSKTDYTQNEMKQDAWAPKNAISFPSSEKIGYLSVGGKNAERRIVNLAPGYSDTDAVNVSQLRALEEAILYGNTLDDESDINSGVKYLSVKGLDELKTLVTKKHDYESYTKLKKEYLKLKLRKVINKETIDLSRYEEKLGKYQSKYKDFKGTASKLEALDKQISVKDYGPVYTNNTSEEDKEDIKKSWYNQLFVDIENAEKTDKSDENINKLITPENKAKIDASNFFSDGAKASGSMAIGVGAMSKAKNSIVIGQNSKIEDTKVSNTILLGNNTSATAANAVALGHRSVADRTVNQINKAMPEAFINSELASSITVDNLLAGVSVGKNGGDLSELNKTKDGDKETILRQIVNVAPGTKDTDVVILAQLKEGVRQAKGHFVSINGNNSKAGNYNNDGATQLGAIAIGVGASATAKNTIAIGSSTASGTGNIVIGKESKTKGDNNNDVASEWAIVIGNNSKAYKSGDNNKITDVVVLGGNANASETGAVAIGNRANVTGLRGVAIGSGGSNDNEAARVSVNDGIALGSYSISNRMLNSNNSKGYDPLTNKNSTSTNKEWNAKLGALSIGDETRTRQITGVAAGFDDTDAVNVAQLKNVSLKYKANGINQQSIKLSEGSLNFKDGVHTTASVDANGTVKFDLNESTKTKINNIGIGQIAANNKGTVTGETVHNYMNSFSNTLELSKDGNTRHGSVNLKNNKLHVAGNSPISVDISGSKITVKLDEGYKTKIDNALSESVADTKYAKIDGSNITANKDTWRQNLEVYSKNETNAAINKAKETVEKGEGINVTPSDSTNGGKKFTVSLDNGIKTKIDNIGTGEVAQDNKNTVTGAKVYEAIADAKTELDGKIKAKVDNNTFTEALNKKANTDLDNITGKGQKVIKDLISAEGQNGIEIETENADTENSNAKKFKVKLSSEYKNKIDNALKNDLTNLEEKAKNTIKGIAVDAVEVKGTENQIKVKSNKNDNKNTFTVSLDEAITTKLNTIGTGSVTAADDKTVTGKAVHDAINTAKLELSNTIGQKLDKNTFNVAEFGLKGNDGEEVKKKLNNTIEIKGSETAASSQTNIYVSKNNAGDGLEIKLGETLTGISSIGKDDSNKLEFKKDTSGTIDTAELKVGGNTLTFTKADNTVKLSGLSDGKIEASSNDVITGNQLNDLGTTHLGLTVNDANTGFKAPNFKQLKKADGQYELAQTTFVEAINKNVDKINEGLKFGIATAVDTSTSNSNEITRQLGAKLNFAGDKYIKPTIVGEDIIKYSLEVLSQINETQTQPDTQQQDLNDKLVTGTAVKKYVDEKTKNIGNSSVSFDIKGDDDSDTYILGGDNSTLKIVGDSTNISTSIDTTENKKVKIALKEELSSIKSITGKNGVKISLDTTDTNKITLSAGPNNNGNDVTLTGLGKGSIDANSKDAISGAQLHDLASKLGITPTSNDNKTFVTDLSFNKLKDSNGNDAGNESTSFKDAITKNIEALNRGFKIAGDKFASDSSGKTQYLGSTTTIKSGDLTTESTYKGKNLKTEYKYENGNGIVSIGMIESPEFKSITLKNGDGKQAGTISVDDEGNVNIKNGNGGSGSKIVTESGFNTLSGNGGIKVSGNGKVFGEAITLSLEENSIDNSKLKDKTITEAKLNTELTNKINKTFKVKANTESDDLLGKTLEFVAGNNLTVELDNTNSKITYGLRPALTGIESIKKDDNKATLTLGDNTASLENTKDKSKIELTNEGILLTTNSNKTIKVKDNELSGVNKISAVSTDTTNTNTNSIDLANGSDTNKNVVITSGGKTLTIAKDGANGKEGISLTGLADRKVGENDYGTSDNSGRAATESALLDLKTKGLTFAVNEKNTDSNPKTLKRELGETLKITGKDEVIDNFDTTYSLDNIATKIDNSKNAIRIGLLKTPRFDALELGKTADKKITLTPNENGDTLELKLTGAGNDTKVKISGIANGTGDNDVINKLQLDAVKTELGDASLNFSDGTKTFTRKNSEKNKTVKIMSGKNVIVALDETKDSGKTGEFTVSLNKTLTGIDSISKGDNKSKIEFNDDSIVLTPATGKTITFDKDGKISGLTDGKIADDSNDMITGKQLHELGATHLGLTVNNAKTGFTAPTFTQLKKADGQDEVAPTTFADAIKKNAEKLNAGLKFKDDNNENNTDKIHYLGSTISFVKWVNTPDGTETQTPTYTGENLTTKYTYENGGNAKIEIGFKESPTFKKVKITENPQDGTDAVNKQYVDGLVAGKASALRITSDSGNTNNISSTLTIKGKEDNNNNKHQNIKTAASGTYLTIELNKDLKGIESVGKDDKAKISFSSDNANNNITFTVGDTDKATVKLDKDGLDLGNKQIKNVASGIGTTTPSNVDKVLTGGESIKDIKNNVVNVQDLSDVAKEIIGKGLSFKGNKENTHKQTLKLGNILNIESTDITTEIKPKENSNNEEFILTLDLKKSGNVTENDSKVVTSGAVYTAIKNAKTKVIKDDDSSDALTITATPSTSSGIESVEYKISLNETQLINNLSNGADINNPQTKLVTDTQVKNYVSSQINGLSSTLSIVGDNSKSSGTQNEKTPVTTVNLKTQKLEIVGTANQIETTVDASNPKISINLSENVTKKLDVINVDSTKKQLAIGKDSELVDPKKSNSTAEINKIKFDFKSGISTDDSESNKKEVISIGSNRKERIITRVAAGELKETSTDAVNGGQLYSVANTFSKLATEVLGAEVEDNNKTGFKTTTFDKVKYYRNPHSQGQPQQDLAPKTFKEAITETITAINKGIIFKAGSGTNNTITKQLGETLEFTGNDYITASVDSTDTNNKTIKYSVNVSTSLDDNTTSQDGTSTQNETNNKLVTGTAVKNYVNSKISSLSSTLNLEADNTVKESNSPKGKVNLKENSLVINGDTNITTSVKNEDNKVSITLKSNLTGIESVGKDDKAKISFSSDTSDDTKNKISFTVKDSTFTFDKNGLDLGNKKLTNVASGLEVSGTSDKTTNIANVLSGSSLDNIKSNAVNVQDLSDVAKAISDKGFKIKGNDSTSEQTLKLGSILNVDSSESNTKETNGQSNTDKKVKDITTKIEKVTDKDELTLKLELNKANTVDGNDERVVTSKAVVNYLKGTGQKSVKISDNPDTKAEGEGSVSIGDGAVSQNTGSVALGYGANALNEKSISIGQGSNVTGSKAVSLGSNNKVEGASSVALGEENKIKANGVQSYVLGTNNTVDEKDNIVIGSRNKVSTANNILLGSDIEIKDPDITGAIVLGDHSKAEKNAVSVGNDNIKRRIINVADPTKEYDAVNKKYVDDLLGKSNNKLDDIDSNKPFVFKNETGEEIVKGKDGKLYKKDDLKDATYDPDKQKYMTKDNAEVKHLTDDEAKKVIVSLNDDKPITIGNVASGLDSEKVGKGLISDGDAKKLILGENNSGGLNNLSDVNKLNKVATIGDLQALSIAGLTFIGNDDTSELHKKLGETLTIKGDRTTPKVGTTVTKTFESAKDNINVVIENKDLVVQLSKELKNLKSAEFDGEVGYGANVKVPVKTKLDAEGLVLEELKPNEKAEKTEYKLGKAVFTKGKAGDSNREETTINHQGTNVRDTVNKKQSTYYSDGTTINELDDSGQVKENGKSAEYKLDGISIKEDKDKEVLNIKNKNGKGEINFAKEGNGTDAKGTGKITGLADITDESTGDTAVNKNYVDSILKANSDKIESIDKNVPVVYKDKDGNKVIKKTDGKFVKIIKENDMNKEEPINEDNVVVGLKDGNSGLGIKDDSNKKDIIDKLLGNNDSNASNPNASNDINTNALTTAKDLQALGQAGMDFEGDYASTGEDKVIHNNLGQKLTIKGKSSDDVEVPTKDKLSDGNIGVVADKDKKTLSVGLSKDLKNLTSAEFITDDTTNPKTKTTITGKGTTIAELDEKGTENGKKAEYTIDGTKITDGISTLETNSKGIVLKHKTTDELNKVTEKDIFSITNDNGKVKIKGLVDIESSDSGDTVVNKKYVDDLLGKSNNKLDDVDSNKPFVFKNEDGKEVVKGKDGKLYKKDSKDGTPLTDDEAKKVIVSINDDKPITIGNVGSGLGISDDNPDNKVKDLVSDKLNNKLNNVATVKDLKALATTGFNVEGNDGKKHNVKLADTLKIQGKDNINVSKTDDGLLISMSSNLSGIDSITMDNVKISKDGLDNGGNRIKNVADGIDSSDVATVGQLNKVNSKVSSQIASAIAMSNLPQVGDNRLFSIGAATGYSGKEYAIALGISGTEKTNKFIYKLSAGIDSQKNVSVGAGFNYNIGNTQKSHDNNLQKELKELRGKAKELDDVKDELKELKNQMKQLMNKHNSTANQNITKLITGYKTNLFKLTKSQVKEIKDFLNSISKNKKLEIVGYTDLRGEDKYNLSLGYKRAVEVANIAIELGFENVSVKSSGFNTITDDKDNYVNRRVEITVK